jgi:hypothetical protein
LIPNDFDCGADNAVFLRCERMLLRLPGRCAHIAYWRDTAGPSMRKMNRTTEIKTVDENAIN